VEKRVLILGAAGRDFHNFNVVYRDDASVRVVAFTATQIPGIGGRRYPAALAGPSYPEGIPIADETQLDHLCARERVDEVVFAYSDVRHETVMHLASRALAGGADFILLGPHRTMIEAGIPVIAVSATRTGSGKSQIARWLGRHLRGRGHRVAVLRHPMPYGDLERQRVQRFAATADLDAAQCTTEEREEYEPHLAAGNVVYAGVDYAAITAAARRDADIIVWDGGNNDFPLLRPDFHMVVVDALRPGQAAAYHPGEAVLRMADLIVVNKVDAAAPATVEEVSDEARALNSTAPLVRAASPVSLERADEVRGRRVVVVEDGPTITHGGMPYGAGFIAAAQHGATVIDPRDTACGALRRAFAAYPHIGRVLPALGYSGDQLADLRASIDRSDADFVIAATPIDLAKLLNPQKPVLRARYEFAEAGEPTLASHVDDFLARFAGT
jgi:predicted GTPase